MSGTSRRSTDLALFRRMVSEARPYRRHIGGIFVVSMLAAPLALLTPVPLQIAVDSAIGSHPLPAVLDPLVPNVISDSKDGVLIFAAAMFLTVAVLKQLQDLGNTILKTYTGEKLVLGFSSKLFQQSQRLSLAYHDRVGTSDSTYRVQEDAKALQYIMVESLISLITAATTLAAMLYVTAMIDVQLALVALAVSPVLFLAARHFRPRMRATAREVKKLESGALSVVQEVLTSLRVVKAFGQEEREHDRFYGQSSLGMRARIRLRLIEGGYALLVGTIIGAGGGLVLFVGVHHVQSEAITLGELLLIMGYLTLLYEPIRMMARKAGSLQDHLASAERAFALLDEAPEVPERPDARPLTRAAGAIEFRDVSFSYVPDRLAIDEVSFGVEPGICVGVAGATGAGKTTVMNLLTRIYDPTAGSILLDRVDLRDYRVADLRNQFGIVLQEPVLFSTTIAENIAYARPDADRHAVEAAATAANIHDFIAGLPEGYETQVGERGMRLSGGERQRLSLARAFLKDAPILILDEPTSSVDVKTEALIMDAMRRLMAGRTSFMIAHRLSTLEICDLWLELDKGRIVSRRGRAAAGRTGEVRLTAGTADATGRRQLKDHPAVRAWRSLGGDTPREIRVLKRGRRLRKSSIFVFEGVGDDGSAVVAKLTGRETAETESHVYEELLPLLPEPSLRYYGQARDKDRGHSWLFLADAGGAHYSPAEPEHRRLAAQWLALIQLHGEEIVEAAHLPDRGPRHYLVHLLRARDSVARQLRRQRGDAAAVLARLVDRLDMLEAEWGELASQCDGMPRTLVHADLVPKNLRVTRDEHGASLAVFDWEMAGVGIQAPDLSQLLEPERSALARRERTKRMDRFSANPCLDTYGDVLTSSGMDLGVESVERMAELGNLFRCLAGIDWTLSQATATWCPTDDLRVYSGWLDDAIELAGAGRGAEWVLQPR